VINGVDYFGPNMALHCSEMVGRLGNQADGEQTYKASNGATKRIAWWVTSEYVRLLASWKGSRPGS
jgi:hypothetical protein